MALSFNHSATWVSTNSPPQGMSLAFMVRGDRSLSYAEWRKGKREREVEKKGKDGKGEREKERLYSVSLSSFQRSLWILIYPIKQIQKRLCEILWSYIVHKEWRFENICMSWRNLIEWVKERKERERVLTRENIYSNGIYYSPCQNSGLAALPAVLFLMLEQDNFYFSNSKEINKYWYFHSLKQNSFLATY